MTEEKKSLKWLTIYSLFLAVNSIFYVEIIPDQFSFFNISSIYLLVLSTCLILRYYLRVAEHDRVKRYMLMISAQIFLLILLRCIKYSAFGPELAIGRYVWYLYYLPMLLIPLFLFYISLYLFSKYERQTKRNWIWVAVITVALILLVLTNDLHQQVFSFQPNFVNWDGDYSHGWGYIVIAVWQYVLYAAAIAVLIAKCSIAGNRKHALVIIIPFVIGIALQLLLLTGKMPKLFGNNIMGFPETICFMVAGVLECCMQLGLIPTNESYDRLMGLTSIPVQITDRFGNCIYQSGTAEKLTEEQFILPDKTRIGIHSILRRMEIPGGFGFWKKDVAEIDLLNEELADAKIRLSEETELIRLQNELKEKQEKIEQKTLIYDDIAKATQKESLAISCLAKEAMHSEDKVKIDQCRKHIALLGAYLKRYANLKLLSSEKQEINTGELGLSVAEVLRYLNMYGIPGELMNTSDMTVLGYQALSAFEAFDELIESNLNVLHGVCIHLSVQNEIFLFKLTLENMHTALPAETREKLASAFIKITFEQEDDVGYYCFTFLKEGDKAW